MLDRGSLGRFRVALVGNGIHGYEYDFRDFLYEFYNLSFVCSFLACDVLPEHSRRLGPIGTHGVQQAVFAVKGVNELLVLGCRMSVNTCGYNAELIHGKDLYVVDCDGEGVLWRKPKELWVGDIGEWFKTVLA